MPEREVLVSAQARAGGQARALPPEIQRALQPHSVALGMAVAGHRLTGNEVLD